MISPVSITPAVVSGPHGPVPLRTYSPGPGAAQRALLWLHGGAFVFGNLDMAEADWVARQLAERTATVVVSVDYRLAGPGTHYPVALDDVLAAWTDFAERYPGRPLYLGGASAGGNLALAAALRLRDSGQRQPDGLILAYPTLHAESPPTSAEFERRIEGHVPPDRFTPADVWNMYRGYLGEDPIDPPPHAVPGTANPAGLPRTLVVTSEFDRLRPSGEAFAAAFHASGGHVRLECEPGTRHGHLNEPEGEGEAAALASIHRMAAWLAGDADGAGVPRTG